MSECAFPRCPHTAEPDREMCTTHRNVRINGSYVNDRHTEGGHG